ncbi:MAG: ribonuclease III [Erysipelotrichaceae bacterium]
MNCITYLKEMGIDVSNEKLIHTAFTHSSYVNEHKEVESDNERLEFMGDAVLQVWTSTQLYQILPPLPEGKMTTLRAQLVCEKSLANYSRELGFNQYIKLGQGEEKTGGRDRDSILADMFEAVLGAVYLDAGMESANIILTKVLQSHLSHPEDEIVVDFKTKLQEYIQSDNRKSISYEVVRVVGPSNNPEFTIHVKVDEIILGKGIGKSKKKAEQKAAQDAFEKMVR